MKMVAESREMASGGNSLSRQGAGTEISVPELGLTMTVAAELFVDGGSGL